MKVLSAYLLAKVGGNDEPSAEDIRKILGSVGIEAEDEKLELLLSQVKGKDLAELIASGREKMALVACAVGGPVAISASAGVAGASAAGDATKEEEVEEKKELCDEEDSGLFGLFD